MPGDALVSSNDHSKICPVRLVTWNMGQPGIKPEHGEFRLFMVREREKHGNFYTCIYTHIYIYVYIYIYIYIYVYILQHESAVERGRERRPPLGWSGSARVSASLHTVCNNLATGIL
jgi:hypothetical protein